MTASLITLMGLLVPAAFVFLLVGLGLTLRFAARRCAEAPGPKTRGSMPDPRIFVIQETRAKLGRGALLAVSLEPQGGSPTGLPTDPVVAAGDCGRSDFLPLGETFYAKLS